MFLSGIERGAKIELGNKLVIDIHPKNVGKHII